MAAEVRLGRENIQFCLWNFVAVVLCFANTMRRTGSNKKKPILEVV
jgi:hypothetical protein